MKKREYLRNENGLQSKPFWLWCAGVDEEDIWRSLYQTGHWAAREDERGVVGLNENERGWVSECDQPIKKGETTKGEGISKGKNNFKVDYRLAEQW